MKAALRLGLALVLLVCTTAVVSAEVTLQSGIDVFTTPADGTTAYDFVKDPIPANFFCEGSAPFTGKIALKGLPLASQGSSRLAAIDTVVERLDEATLDASGAATTRLRMTALSLVSIAPLQTSCGAFHTYVTLQSQQRTTVMHIHRTHTDGGYFVGPLAVDARLVFVPVEGKSARRLELAGSFTFPGTTPIPWKLRGEGSTKPSETIVVDTNGDRVPDSRPLSTSNFYAGARPTLTPGEAVPWLEVPTRWLLPDCGDGYPVCHEYSITHVHCACA